MQLTKINYQDLNSRQKENYNFTKIAAILSDYGFTCILLSDSKEEGRDKLNSVLSQADIVVCPTDCISHDAYKCVKQHCTRQDKQLVMIPHASLASFKNGLSKITKPSVQIQ